LRFPELSKTFTWCMLNLPFIIKKQEKKIR
jgi:hypothetical protein